MSLPSPIIQAEQLRTYFREALDQAVAGCIVIALFGAWMSRVLPLGLVAACVLAVWLLAVDLRAASGRVEPEVPGAFARWNRRQMLAGGLAGLSWGVLAGAAIVLGGAQDQFLALMLVAIVATISAGDGAAMPQPTLAFVLGCLVPPALALLAHEGPLYWMLLAMMGVLIGVTVMQLGKRHQAFVALHAARADLLAMTRDLQEARDRAESASEAKTRFLASISHELRSPLQAILGSAALLETSATEVTQRARHIRRAGEHLLAVINQILDLARQNPRYLRLQSEPFSPRAFLEETIEMVRSAAEQKGLAVSLVVDVSPKIRLMGDVVRLRQAVLNYWANAVKFSERGQIVVKAKLSPVAPDAGKMSFWVGVQDDGPGIASEMLPRLFQPFEQADPEASRRFGGSGLGLALTKQMIEAMGGTVGVQSQLGEGSEFWLEVQLDVVKELSTNAAIAENSGDDFSVARVTAPWAIGKTILVVDDSPLNREVLGSILNRLGFQVDVAEDGAEAVAKAVAGHAYAAILMDVQMPGMDGLEAARRIRSGPGGKEMPILAISASVFEEDWQRCHAAGMNELLGKPVTPITLLEALARYVHER